MGWICECLTIIIEYNEVPVPFALLCGASPPCRPHCRKSCLPLSERQSPLSHLTAELISDPLLPSGLLMFKLCSRQADHRSGSHFGLCSQSWEQCMKSTAPSPQAHGKSMKYGEFSFLGVPPACPDPEGKNASQAVH